MILTAIKFKLSVAMFEDSSAMSVRIIFHRNKFTMVLKVMTFYLHHDDVIKWKHFPRYWPFVRGIHRSPVNSPHKGQWRGALMFSLNCAWIKGWVNNSEVGDLRHHRAHYDVTVTITSTLLNDGSNTATHPREQTRIRTATISSRRRACYIILHHIRHTYILYMYMYIYLNQIAYKWHNMGTNRYDWTIIVYYRNC